MTKQWKLALTALLLAAVTFSAVVYATLPNDVRFACNRFCNMWNKDGTWDLDMCAACCYERNNTDECQIGCVYRKEPVKCDQYDATGTQNTNSGPADNGGRNANRR